MRFGLAFAVISALLISGCDRGVVTREESVNLSPSVSGGWTQTTYSYPANDTSWPCPLDRQGTGSNAADIPEALVGFEHSYDAGTRPFPCSRKLILIHRSALQFDLAEVKNHLPRVFVTSAALHYKRKPDPEKGRMCGDSLLLATESWEGADYKKLPPGEVYSKTLPESGASCGLGGCSIDVTTAVRNWVSGAEPQYGFVLKGENEATDSKDNDMCLTRYSDVSLSVNYKYDLVPIFPPEK